MRGIAWVGFLCSALGFACGSNGSDPSDAAAEAAAEAGPPACTSDQATTDQSCGTLNWATSGTQSRLRNHHMTYVVKAQDGSGSLVAVAGVNGGTLMHDTDVAPIAADGTVGAFVSGPHYPVYVGGLTGANANGVLVGAGGNNGVQHIPDVYTSVVEADGTLDAWQKQAPMNVGRMHAASFAIGSRIWILGGFDDTDVLDDAIFADVGADGTIGAWTSAGKLSAPLTHFAIAYARGFVYLTGGLSALPTTNPPSHKNVIRGTVEADGTIDGWISLKPLPAGLSTHASFVYGGYLYIAGGIDDTPAQLANVRRAPLEDDRTIGAWEDAAPLPIARGHVHQLPFFGQHVYSVAGAIDFSLSSTDAIFVGGFP